MKVTLITPSFNQAEFLERTLNSIVAQEYQDLELLVYDGGSTDGSQEIIRCFENHITHWETGPDGGQSNAINKGFRRATGDVVGWLNSDDTLLPGALQRVTAAFDEHPEADVVYGDFVYVNSQDEVLRYRHVFRHFRYETLYFHDFLGQPAVFYKRAVLNKIGLLDEALEYSMDWDFFLRMKRECTMVHCGTCLATYRLHSNAKTSQEGDLKYREDLETIHNKNRLRRFDTSILNALHYGFFRFISLFQRLYIVLRDNPLDYVKVLRIVTGGRIVRGLLWRMRNG